MSIAAPRQNAHSDIVAMTHRHCSEAAMKAPAIPAALGFALFFTFAPVTATEAAEVKVFTARAIATVLNEIGPAFERTTGHTLDVISGLPPEFLTRINAGEPFDLIVTGSSVIDGMIKDGKLVAETRINLVRSGIGVEVRAGAPKPDISSVEAFKRALVEAKSIGYLKVGSGIYLAALLDRLGIAEAIASKVTRPDTDIVSELVAKGEIELGMVVITQIMTTPGVELVGPLPAEIQSYITFAAGVSAKAKAPDAARQLLNFLQGPIAAPVIKTQGMEPAN
jgi:molybdate transport system substrate-binding protein